MVVLRELTEVDAVALPEIYGSEESDPAPQLRAENHGGISG
jgi:hypothetical protein